MASKLRRHTLPETISLVETLEQSELGRFKSFLVYDGLDAPHEVLELVLRMGAADHVSWLNKLHVGMNETGVHMVRV